LGRDGDPHLRQRLIGAHSEERLREWTNARVRDTLKAGGTPGPESSIGKVHQGELNQRIQLLATDVLGSGACAWEAGGDSPGRRAPFEVKGMLRSRANTIEGGTTEINKTIIGERVLGLPREPDPWQDVAWKNVPRN
jgi:alkylation response protein AidB-like acyl-CoA dehydrogenase